MRCLRSISAAQQEGHVFLSAENFEILKKELEANFRISVDEFQDKPDDGKRVVMVKVRKPPVFVDIVERKTRYELIEKEIKDGYSLGLDEIDTTRYRIVGTDHDLRDLDRPGEAKRDLTALREDLEYSEVMLVAEIARYLNMSPLRVEELLERTEEGIPRILKWANLANSILYEIVIPRLFEAIYEIEEFKGKEHVVRKLLVKDPPDGDDGYEVRVDPHRFAEENAPEYRPFAGKSFHLSGYGFDSAPEYDFFRLNLPSEKIKNIWFTGMLTAGQTEFFVHYMDPISNSLRSYYPDFLIELEDGGFLIVEIKGEHLMDDPVTQAKAQYAKEMAQESKMRYVLIPSAQAGISLVKD